MYSHTEYIWGTPLHCNDSLFFRLTSTWLTIVKKKKKCQEYLHSAITFMRLGAAARTAGPPSCPAVHFSWKFCSLNLWALEAGWELHSGDESTPLVFARVESYALGAECPPAPSGSCLMDDTSNRWEYLDRKWSVNRATPLLKMLTPNWWLFSKSQKMWKCIHSPSQWKSDIGNGEVNNKFLLAERL